MKTFKQHPLLQPLLPLQQQQRLRRLPLPQPRRHRHRRKFASRYRYRLRAHFLYTKKDSNQQFLFTIFHKKFSKAKLFPIQTLDFTWLPN